MHQLIELAVFHYPEGMEGMRCYRIEYGGHGEDCVREEMIWLPAHVDPERIENILNEEEPG